MKSWRLHIVFTVLIGLGALLLPGKGIACDNVKHARSTIATTQAHAGVTGKAVSKKHCTKSTQPCDGKQKCHGKCGHKSCTCTGSSAVAMQATLPAKTKALFDRARKQRFYTSADAISAGFCSTWLLPKIG